MGVMDHFDLGGRGERKELKERERIVFFCFFFVFLVFCCFFWSEGSTFKEQIKKKYLIR